jgi:hypothetical protein
MTTLNLSQLLEAKQKLEAIGFLSEEAIKSQLIQLASQLDDESKNMLGLITQANQVVKKPVVSTTPQQVETTTATKENLVKEFLTKEPFTFIYKGEQQTLSLVNSRCLLLSLNSETGLYRQLRSFINDCIPTKGEKWDTFQRSDTFKAYQNFKSQFARDLLDLTKVEESFHIPWVGPHGAVQVRKTHRVVCMNEAATSSNKVQHIVELNKHLQDMSIRVPSYSFFQGGIKGYLYSRIVTKIDALKKLLNKHTSLSIGMDRAKIIQELQNQILLLEEDFNNLK